jgi:hypothetical protein
VTAITVTAQHIAEGVRESCVRCPVALAIADAFPGVPFWVGSAHFFLEEEEVEIDLPADAKEFISSFDDSRPVEPFSFTLDYPAATP